MTSFRSYQRLDDDDDDDDDEGTSDATAREKPRPLEGRCVEIGVHFNPSADGWVRVYVNSRS